MEARCGDATRPRALRVSPRQPAHAGAGGRRLRCASRPTTCSPAWCAALGATVTPISAPFEPEAGAYAGGHHHHSGDAKHGGIIHDMAARARSSAMNDGNACARAPAAAREPGAADRRLQLFAGARVGGRGGHRARCGQRADAGSATCCEYAIGPARRPSLWRCMHAAAADDWPTFIAWNAWFRASRETVGAARRDRADGRRAGQAAGRTRPRSTRRRARWPRRNAPVTLPAAFALAARRVGRRPRSTHWPAICGRGSKTRCWRR